MLGFQFSTAVNERSLAAFKSKGKFEVSSIKLLNTTTQ
jgi:hypothetical protein